MGAHKEVPKVRPSEPKSSYKVRMELDFNRKRPMRTGPFKSGSHQLKESSTLVSQKFMEQWSRL